MTRRANGLPDTYTAIRTDERGEEYVVHKPSGVRYYIRRPAPDIEELRRARLADERIGAADRAPGDVRIIGGNGAAALATGKRKAKRGRGPRPEQYRLPIEHYRDPGYPTQHRDQKLPPAPYMRPQATQRATARFEDGSEPQQSTTGSQHATQE